MLIIDGHNLIGRLSGLSLEREEEAREIVLRRVGAMKGSGGGRVMVVFDGNRPGSAKSERFGGLEVVYSPQGGCADDEILRRLAEKPRGGATVVTSDRRLAERARGLGARVETADDFAARFRRRTTGQEVKADGPQVDAAEVDRWLELFAKGKPEGRHKM